jgi:hypothetical protein
LSKGFEDCYTAYYDRLDRENAKRSGIASGKEEESFKMFVVRAGSPERKNQDDGSKSNTHDDTL